RRHALERCQQYGGYIDNMREHRGGLDEATENMLTHLVRELERSSIRVIFFTPPYYRAYNKGFHPRRKTPPPHPAGRSAAAPHPRYFDFSTEADFIDDRDLFLDSDHLGTRGKAKFSKLFREVLAGGHT